MKKAVLLSVFMLNLAFGVDIQELERDCNVRNNMDSCNTLVNIYAGLYGKDFQNEEKYEFYNDKLCDFFESAAHCYNTARRYLSKTKKYINKVCSFPWEGSKRDCQELRKIKLY